MRCAKFLEHFSEFVDETAPAGLQAALDEHLDACPSCRSYWATWSEGRRLLEQTLDIAELAPDFHERLQHRIYSVDDRRAIARYGPARGATAGLVAIALLVVAGILVPRLTAEPEVVLSRIVVDRPERRPLQVRLPLPTVLPTQWRPSPLELSGGDLWDRPWDLFQEYSPVRGRARPATMTRALLD
jgi:predicted anti-sigma-YlaC factor YlaD